MNEQTKQEIPDWLIALLVDYTIAITGAVSAGQSIPAKAWYRLAEQILTAQLDKAVCTRCGLECDVCLMEEE